MLHGNSFFFFFSIQKSDFKEGTRTVKKYIVGIDIAHRFTAIVYSWIALFIIQCLLEYVLFSDCLCISQHVIAVAESKVYL